MDVKISKMGHAAGLFLLRCPPPAGIFVRRTQWVCTTLEVMNGKMATAQGEFASLAELPALG